MIKEKEKEKEKGEKGYITTQQIQRKKKKKKNTSNPPPPARTDRQCFANVATNCRLIDSHIWNKEKR
jgi:hypothetical protein